jgi:hypothetical protein
MNQTLEAFKMNKTQMNRIGGGKDFHCTFSDSGTPGWGGQLPGGIDLHEAPESMTVYQAEDYLQVQLGPEFYIYCEEIQP